ncbi:hypothetical protein AB3Y40_06755 [Yoonia sp. R2331]|uniref:hypothetical protein n=1 Tax=Yoonia sp. R2331 TaxID=3237238 RepID=UPI0034E4EFD4
MQPDLIEQDPVEQAVPPQEFIAFVTQSDNLAGELSEGELSEIARQVIEDHKLDKDSMSDWSEKMQKGIDLAKLTKSDKSYPFPNSANVKYPLITSAALQFNARAYPAIVPSESLVKVKTFGADPLGEKAARAERVSAHMSWQLSEQIEEWEEETDKLLVQLPIVGTMVRKVWYDPAKGRARCRVIDPGNFIVNDKVRNLSEAPRCGEEMPLYPSEIKERINSGQFVDFDYELGVSDKEASHMFVEQHCRLDLDRDDYPEPYIVTVHHETQTVVRIVADFTEAQVRYQEEARIVPMEMLAQDEFGNVAPVTQMQQQTVATGIMSIERGSYFVPYTFMPSMDGGFFGTGLGLILGDISDTINSIINMLLDAGHMAALGGGFIGSEFRIKGQSMRFRPGEWKPVAASGGDVRQSMVPLTYPGPDATLFSMLGMMIEAGKEISSTKDIMTGDTGGKTQTATTTLALIEQGMMVFTAAYKRIFRSLKREYGLIAKINAGTVSPEEYNAFHDGVDPNGQPIQFDPAADYSAADMGIQPVADPKSVTDMQTAAKAQLLMGMAETGLVDQAEAANRVLESANIADREALMPQQDPMAAQMAQFQAEMMMRTAQADLSQKMVDIDLTIEKIKREGAETMKTMAEADAALEGKRLEAMELMMKERKDDLERTLKLGLGIMASQSRNGGGGQGAQGQAGPAGIGGNAGLLVGQTMA